MHIAQLIPSLLSPCIMFIGEKVLFMFMPWFFFKAGLFYKSASLSSVVSKSFHRLLVPWIIFGLIGLIIWIAVGYLMETPTIREIVNLRRILLITAFEFGLPGNPPLWFLIALFSCQVSTIFLQRILHIKPIVIALVFLLMAFLFKFYILDDFIPYTWLSVLTGLFFFGAGSILRDYQYSSRFAAAVGILIVILYAYDDTFVEMRTNGLLVSTQSGYILYFIRALCGIILLNFISDKLNKRYLSQSILTNIGKNSMGYYVWHFPIITVMTYVTSSIQDRVVAFTFSIIAIIIALPALDYITRRYWPEALGLKRDRKRMTAPDSLP